MQIDNSFPVAADPDRVFRFLQDPDNVVACLPGAELVEALGNDSYRGRVRIKIGPVTAAYTGVAAVVKRDPVERVTVVRAEGRDAGGSSAQATTTVRVFGNDRGNGSTVELATDFTVTGRLAQFGRSVMEDVYSRIAGEMAARVRDLIAADHRTEAPVDNNGNGDSGFFRRLFGGRQSRHGVR